MLDVVVLGAGLAGLTVTDGLRQAGCNVHAYEARDRVGGRLHSVELGSHRFDLGATWVWEHERSVQALLQRLAIATFPSREVGDDLVEEGTQVQRGRMPGSWSPERRVVGGTVAIAHALHARNQALVTTGCPAVAIVPTGDAMEVKFADGSRARAQHVIAALPPPLVAPLLNDPATATRLDRVPIWMGDMAKVVAAYQSCPWRAQGLSGRAFSRRGPLVEIHDLSGPTDDDGIALFGFCPRPVVERFGPGLVPAVCDQLTRLFGAPPHAVHVEAWWTSPFTVPAALPPPDDQLFGHASLRPPILERLHLASTETAAQSPGHLDGAVHRAESLVAKLTN